MSGTGSSVAKLTSRLGRLRTGRLILGVVVMLVAIGYTWQAILLPFGTPSKPGAAIFPTVVGIGAIMISIVVIVEALVVTRDPEDEAEFELPRGVQLRHVLVFFGATTLLVILLPILGQYIAGTLYAYGMFMYLGPRKPLNWVKSALYALVLGIAVPYAFVHVLFVLLPKGIVLPALFPGLV